MKSIKKASVASVLSLALAIPLSASAAATIDVAPAKKDSAQVSQSANSTDVNTQKPGDHVITPQDTNKVLAKSLANTDMSERFYIDPHYGYARVFVSIYW
ncbi:hypothetical protein [Paenibacillus sp. 1-18]|uniref:hypothetical protein n=1 Tax=Paenibacillus sp. 1-18 TaxID=1333846 RepID=UPI0004BA72C7|nr:hypothetical protein [Paenibacillus sp. 1-18]